MYIYVHRCFSFFTRNILRLNGNKGFFVIFSSGKGDFAAKGGWPIDLYTEAIQLDRGNWHRDNKRDSSSKKSSIFSVFSLALRFFGQGRNGCFGQNLLR